jgi:hypothetical protein
MMASAKPRSSMTSAMMMYITPALVVHRADPLAPEVGPLAVVRDRAEQRGAAQQYHHQRAHDDGLVQGMASSEFSEHGLLLHGVGQRRCGAQRLGAVRAADVAIAGHVLIDDTLEQAWRNVA